MNHEAQNALLRILEEPPPQTTLVLATATAAGLLATVRSRCQRVRFEPDPGCGATRSRAQSDAGAPRRDRGGDDSRSARLGGGIPRRARHGRRRRRSVPRNRVALDARSRGSPRCARPRPTSRTTSTRSGPSTIAARRCRSATRTPRWWWSARCSHCASPRFDERHLLRHNADLLRECGSAHRPYLHDRDTRHRRPLPPAGG